MLLFIRPWPAMNTQPSRKAAAVGCIITVLHCAVARALAPSCLGINGESVDWWVALKFPGGDAFAYLDNSTAQLPSGRLAWHQGYAWADTSGQPLAATLQQLYQQPVDQELGYIIWNDEFPGGDPPVWEGGAHAKGVLGLGLTQGFYLLHSVPKFPAPASVNCSKAFGNGTYTGIALAQQLYGQSFLCMTMGASDLNTIAQMATDEEVWVYDHHIPLEMSQSYPSAVELASAAYGRTVLSQESPVIRWGEPLETLRGQQAITFAKSPSISPIFLYEQIVEPSLQSGMLWETWQHGSGDLPPNCPSLLHPFFSFTVAAVAVPEGAGWYVLQDHSKWGVTSDVVPSCCQQEGSLSINASAVRAVCFGDLNRQEHQAYRGGSAVCLLKNDAFWATWSDLIQKTQSCSDRVRQNTSLVTYQNSEPESSMA